MVDVSRERWNRIEALFDRALDIPHTERNAFIEEETKGDNALRHELEQLLAGHDEVSDDFLEPFEEAAPSVEPPGSDFIGRRIADFTLREVIGRGGMGVVFLADQEHPSRQVALKLLAS